MYTRMLLTRALLGGVTLAMTSFATAENWQMPTPFGDRNPPTQVAYQFAEEVQDYTDGRLNILVKSGGRLVPHLAIPDAVASGQVVIGEFLLATLDKKNPVLGHDMVPFIANNYSDAQTLWNAAKADTQAALEKLGLTYLYVVPWTPYSLFSTKPVKQLSDFKGESIRAFTQTGESLIKTLQAKPVQIPLNSVTGAFSQGTLTGRFASLSVGEFTQAWTYAPYLNDLRVWIPKEIVVMNKKAFDGLDGSTRNAILRAAANAERRGWLLTQERVAADLEALVDGGIKYSQPTQQLLNELKPISEQMKQEWVRKDPKRHQAILQGYQEAQRAP